MGDGPRKAPVGDVPRKAPVEMSSAPMAPSKALAGIVLGLGRVEGDGQGCETCWGRVG